MEGNRTSPPALPQFGFVRMRDLVGDRKRGTLGIIPVTRACIHRWIYNGKFPKPLKISSKVSVWPVAVIRDICVRIEREGSL